MNRLEVRTVNGETSTVVATVNEVKDIVVTGLNPGIEYTIFVREYDNEENYQDTITTVVKTKGYKTYASLELRDIMNGNGCNPIYNPTYTVVSQYSHVSGFPRYMTGNDYVRVAGYERWPDRSCYASPTYRFDYELFFNLYWAFLPGQVAVGPS